MKTIENKFVSFISTHSQIPSATTSNPSIISKKLNHLYIKNMQALPETLYDPIIYFIIFRFEYNLSDQIIKLYMI